LTALHSIKEIGRRNILERQCQQKILQQACQGARHNSSHQQKINPEYYDHQVLPHQYQKGQWVMMKMFNLLH
jgi:hypothetical protein